MKDALVAAIRGLTPGDTRQYLNLAVVPLLRKDGRAKLERLVLEEALKEGMTVAELKDPNVPTLEISNDTGKEVMIVAGEYVVGGGQNRMVAASACIAAGYKGLLPVRCVEQRRWNPRGGGKFGYGGHTTTDLKTSARTQGEVWDGVTTILGLTGTRSGTEDYSQVMAQKKEEFEDIAGRFPRLPDQVGLVAVIALPDRKKYALELFDDPDLMRRHYEKILHAYAAEALPYGDTALSVKPDEVTAFLREVESATLNLRHAASRGEDYEVRTSNAEGSTLLSGDTTLYLNLVSAAKGR